MILKTSPLKIKKIEEKDKYLLMMQMRLETLSKDEILDIIESAWGKDIRNDLSVLSYEYLICEIIDDIQRNKQEYDKFKLLIDRKLFDGPIYDCLNKILDSLDITHLVFIYFKLYLPSLVGLIKRLFNFLQLILNLSIKLGCERAIRQYFKNKILNNKNLTEVKRAILDLYSFKI